MAYLTPESREKHREEQRRYKERHPQAHKLACKRYYKKHEAKIAESKRLRLRDPLKFIKHNAVRWVFRAVRDGRLIRPSACSHCGKKCKPEGHHADYSKKLEVIWLCRKCHSLLHRRESR